VKRQPRTHFVQQLDFWPELRNPHIQLYATLSAQRAPARSVSEDGRTVSRKAASLRDCAMVPDGNHGDNLSQVLL
jgi:hypothetical protein